MKKKKTHDEEFTQENAGDLIGNKATVSQQKDNVEDIEDSITENVEIEQGKSDSLNP